MIQYALKCDQGHRFDSWFQSAAAFDKLAAAGLVACAVCGATRVEKAMMTPSVRPARKAAAPVSAETAAQAGSGTDPRPGAGALRTPRNALEQKLAELRRQVEENSDYVGGDFADQARAMHEGRLPNRAIHGEAALDEARSLLEDGVPVAPLPFLTGRKTN